MNEIEWDESYSVKNQEIDDQHKEWIAIFNRLHNAMLSDKKEGYETIGANALQAMLDYTEHHFALEEEYLCKINYPELVPHRRLHRDFSSQIYQYNEAILQRELILNTQIIKIIKDWLVYHIREEDKKYSVYAESRE